jgi:hypothetical protein
MRYVDAGYAVALATLFVYGVSLLARRRRWERAYETSEEPSPVPNADGPAARREQS